MAPPGKEKAQTPECVMGRIVPRKASPGVARRAHHAFLLLLPEKYFSEKAMAWFSLVKLSEAERTLASISQDVFRIVQHFTGHRQVEAMYSYSLLTRVFREQCRVKETADGELVEI